MEEYRKVIEWENWYEVSDEGNVKSLDRWVINNGTPEFRKGKVLKIHVNKYRSNYCDVLFCVNNIKKRIKVHQLVARAFPEICGEWFDGCEIDHLDGNPLNNKATNLRVTDKKGNMNNPLTRKNCSEAWTPERREERSKKMKENNPAQHYQDWSPERKEAHTKRMKERWANYRLTRA